MGSKIKVNHKQLADAASEIKSYTLKLSNDMRFADSEISMMYSQWQGTDATAFQKKWNTMYDSDSVYLSMKNTLNAYADFLSYSSQKYLDAHARALNNAKKL